MLREKQKNEQFTEIKSSEQLEIIIETQELLHTRADVAEIMERFRAKNKSYTIFSIQDENDGSPSYITYGIRYLNNIGYYVFEGNFILPNDIEL